MHSHLMICTVGFNLSCAFVPPTMPPEFYIVFAFSAPSTMPLFRCCSFLLSEIMPFSYFVFMFLNIYLLIFVFYGIVSKEYWLLICLAWFVGFNHI